MAVLDQKQVAMVLTLVPVGPRQKELKDQWFALQMALSYEGGGTTEGTAAAELLPWAGHFKFGSDDVTVLLHEDGDENEDKLPTVVTGKLAAVNAGTVNDAVNKKIPLLKNKEALDAAKKWIDGPTSIVEWSPKAIGAGRDGDDNNAERLMEKMAFLSTFPGAISQELGLVHYFSINQNVAIGTGKGYQLIATLGSASHQELKPSPADFKFWKEPPGGGAPAWTDGWQYKDKNVKCYVKPLVIKRGASGYLSYDDEPAAVTTIGPSFDDYWVRVKAERPWGDRIDDICAALGNFSSLIHRLYSLKPDTVANGSAWEALLAMSPRRFARWGDPSAPVGKPAIRTEQLLTRLVVDNLLASGSLAQVKQRLITFRTDLLALPDANGDHPWRLFLEKLWSRQKLAMGIQEEGDGAVAKANGYRPSLGELAALLSDNTSGVLDDFLSLQLTYAVCFHKQTPSDTLAAAWLEMTAKPEYQKLLSTLDGFAVQNKIKYGGCQFEREGYKRDLRIRASDVVDANGLKTLLRAEMAIDNGTLVAPLLQDYVPCLVVQAVFNDPAWRADWDVRVKQFVDRLVDGPYCEMKPGGLTIQLDRSALESDTGQGGIAPKDDTDAWRKISGFGLLVRDMNTVKKTWRIASAAGLSAFDSTKKLLPLLDGPAVVPLRIPYKGGVRFPFVTYNQRSLVSGCPLADAVNEEFEVIDEDGQSDTGYVYNPVIAGAADSLKLTRLKFGHRYEVAAFVIDTAGGLPAELQAGLPWQFKETFTLNGVPRAKISYFRRVPVGQVRIGGTKLDLSKEQLATFWPIVPDDVAPLAREITRVERAVNRKATVPGDDENEPIALLLDPKNAFEFGVRAPAADIDVIERWYEDSAVGKDGIEHREDLKDLWKQHLLSLRESQPDGNDVNQRGDSSMDDPAVSGILVIYDCYNWLERRWVAVGFDVLDVAMEKRAGTGLQKYRPEPWKVSCRRGTENEKWSIGAADNTKRTIEVVVPSDVSSVGRLKFCALVPKKYVEGSGVEERFAKELIAESGDLYQYADDYEKDALAAKIKTELDAAVKDHHYLAPQTVLLETPTDLMPAAQDVWKYLAVKTVGQELVEVNFVDPGYVGAAPADRGVHPWRDQKWRNVSRAEVVRQAWRWQGRPIHPWPLSDDSAFPQAASAVDDGLWSKNHEDKIRKLLEWEVEAFVDLHDKFDSLFVPTAIDSAAGKSGNILVLYRDDLQRERRSQYLRYGLRVFSRYGTLFSSVPVEGQQVFPVDTAKEQWSVSGMGWKRAFIPYRGVRPKAPVVRAVIPLTEHIDELTEHMGEPNGARNVASLLAVFDEAAFSSCGISETMHVSIAVDERSGQYQYGHDPIVSGSHDGPATVGDPDRALEGPFGYTFDTGARQPLYSSCSYVISPSENALPWDFAKVMFRRLSGMETPEEDVEAARLYTKPQWVQFLPSSSFGLDLVHAQIDSNGQVLTVPALPGLTPTVGIKDDDIELSDLWIIITEKITDFIGQKGSEKYIDVRKVSISDKNKQKFMLDFGQTDGSLLGKNLSFRLAERQRSRLHIEESSLEAKWDKDNFWQSILGAEDEDCPARIVRVSRPFTPTRSAP